MCRKWFVVWWNSQNVRIHNQGTKLEVAALHHHWQQCQWHYPSARPRQQVSCGLFPFRNYLEPSLQSISDSMDLILSSTPTDCMLALASQPRNFMTLRLEQMFDDHEPWRWAWSSGALNRKVLWFNEEIQQQKIQVMKIEWMSILSTSKNCQHSFKKSLTVFWGSGSTSRLETVAGPTFSQHAIHSKNIKKIAWLLTNWNNMLYC